MAVICALYLTNTNLSLKIVLSDCSTVLTNKYGKELDKPISTTMNVTRPYIPGFFMLREYGPIIKTLKLLQNRFDLLLIDVHGVLHPRRCGLASYVGVMLNTPTIGVAKSLLCGDIKENDYIDLNGVVSGFRMVKKNKEPIYISVGHKINLINAKRIVEQLVKPGERIPEPLRLADMYCKTLAHSSMS